MIAETDERDERRIHETPRESAISAEALGWIVRHTCQILDDNDNLNFQRMAYRSCILEIVKLASRPHSERTFHQDILRTAILGIVQAHDSEEMQEALDACRRALKLKKGTEET